MSEFELICFQMIAGAGEARTNFIAALEEAKSGNFQNIDILMKKGDDAYIQGHHAHASLIQEEAKGNKTELSLLLMHAEDQLMNTETFRFLVMELIDSYRGGTAYES